MIIFEYLHDIEVIHCLVRFGEMANCFDLIMPPLPT